MFISQVLFDDNGYLSAPSVNIGNIGQVALVVVLVTISSLKVVITSPQTMPSHVSLVLVMQMVSRLAKQLGLSFVANYNNVVAALNDGTLKLGLHVQALPNGAKRFLHQQQWQHSRYS
jgi:hypothetical protein